MNHPKRPPHPNEVEFIGAIANPGQPLPADLPQVAIAGKSNVGKSTLINRVTNRKKLARVSKRPGKTQEINFYRVDGRFLLSDLPGYGFAKAPTDVRQRWGPLVESYLGSSRGLLGIVLLIDARHGPTKDDWQMIEYLERLASADAVRADKDRQADEEQAEEAAGQGAGEAGRFRRSGPGHLGSQRGGCEVTCGGASWSWSNLPPDRRRCRPSSLAPR